MNDDLKIKNKLIYYYASSEANSSSQIIIQNVDYLIFFFQF